MKMYYLDGKNKQQQQQLFKKVHCKLQCTIREKTKETMAQST